MPAIPVDGAMTLFLQGNSEDLVVYAADERVAMGWNVTALATGLLLLITLVLGCYRPVAIRVKKFLGRRPSTE